MLLRFATHSYQSRSPDVSAERVVNCYAEGQPRDAKTPIAVFNSPGTADFASGLAGAVRGAKRMDGVPYIVAGSGLYSIASTGTATLLGSINTTGGRVGMAVNRASPKELGIVDGTDGWTYDTTNGLVQITDPDFPGGDTLAFLDGYFIVSTPDGRFALSNLDNGQAWTATDVASAEGDPDDTLAVAVSHRQLYVFGEESTEVYYNSGAADFPLSRVEGAFMERGIGGRWTVAGDDNTLFWMGDDRMVYRDAGYRPQRVSTHAIEEIIQKFSVVDDAFAFFVTTSGHKQYHLTFPTGERTFVYDIATGLWHERESFQSRYWRCSAYVRCYNKDIVGDAFEGKCGTLDPDTFTEYGGVMQQIMTSPPVAQDRKRLFHEALEIDIESGVGTTTGGDPQLWLEYSDDGGRTWSARKPFFSMGKIGEYRTRVRWLGLGSSRKRVYRLTIADAVKRTVIAAHLDYKVGLN